MRDENSKTSKNHNSAAYREQSQIYLNYAEQARNLNAEHYNSQFTIQN